MIVCSCNCLSDKQILNAAQAGCQRVTQVHAGLGCRPKCGQCFSTIKMLLDAPVALAAAFEGSAHTLPPAAEIAQAC